MDNRIKLTKSGYEALREELDYLKSTKRKEAAEKLKVARSYGDLSENSEYDEAKNDQAIMEARIADLEVMLKDPIIIDDSEIDTTTVSLGTQVTVRVTDKKTGKSKEASYRIVGSNEAAPREGKISDESAIGKALMGVSLGQEVEVEVPAGIKIYQILAINK